MKIKTKEKLFDISKTIFCIALAGILGAAISHHYKVLEEKNQIYTESRKAATKTYYEIIDLIGERHYFALRAAIGYQYKVDPHERWELYDATVANWNKRRYSTLALINRYFGERAEQQVYTLIKSFSSIHQQLIKVKNLCNENKPIPDLTSLLNEIYKLDDDISIFSKHLQIQLKEGRVDIYIPSPPLEKPK